MSRFKSKADEQLWSAIKTQQASKYGNINIPRLLKAIQSGADVNCRNQENKLPLHKIVSSSKIGRLSRSKRNVYKRSLAVNAIKALLEANANVHRYDGEGWLPLNLALRHKFSTEVVEILLNASANPNSGNKRDLRSARLRGGWNALNFVWNARVLEDNERQQKWQRHVTRRLLNCKANINSRNPSGRAPIHMLLARKQPTDSDSQDLRFLISVGADVDLCYKGSSPLIMAAQKMDIVNSRILIQAGCNLNMQTMNGNTALHVAVKAVSRLAGTRSGRRYVQNMQLFLELTAEYPVLIAKQKAMLQVLHELRLFGRNVFLPQIELLIIQYAFVTSIDTELRNFRGQTARDIGRRFLSDDVLKLLGAPKVTIIPRVV